MRNRNDISVLEVDFTLLKFTKVPSYRCTIVHKTCRYLILALDVALFLLKAIGGIENDLNTNSKGESSKYIRLAISGDQILMSSVPCA